MDPIISPHDTGFIETNSRGNATLVVVEGSAQDYVRRQEEVYAEHSGRRLSARAEAWSDRLRSVVPPVMLAVLIWLLLDGAQRQNYVPVLLVGSLFLCVLVGEMLLAQRSVRRLDRALEALSAEAGAQHVAIRDPQEAAVPFVAQYEGFFEHVAQELTPERRAHLLGCVAAEDRVGARAEMAGLARAYAARWNGAVSW